MTLDLHPEDLIDRASAGTIAPDERKRLDAHLALCDVCRFELRARDSFLAEDSQAAALDLDALVARALGSPQVKQAVATERESNVQIAKIANGNATCDAPLVIPGLRVRPQMQKRMIALLAAALVLISVQAIAGKWNVLHLFVPAKAPVATESEAIDAPKPSSHATKSHGQMYNGGAAGAGETVGEREAANAAVPFGPSVPFAPSAPVVEAAPVAAAADAPAPHVTTFSSASSSSSVRLPASAENHPVDKAAYVPLDSAVGLFDRASRDRAEGHHAAARAAYGQLFQRFPMSPEATLARATYGRMLLDDGDAEGALVQLDTYLAEGDSALREQAFAARATALGREARFDLEVQTWQRLLREYPSSLYAARARERIEEVGSR